MFNKILNPAVTFFFLLLVSCGGGKGGSVSNNNLVHKPESIKAKFIDSPVSGLNYKIFNKGQGVTSSDGTFNCLEGDYVEFYLANKIKIGGAVCSESIYMNQLGLTSNEISSTAAMMIKIHRKNQGNESDLSVLDVTSADLSLDHSLDSISTLDNLDNFNLMLNKLNLPEVTQNIFNDLKSEAKTHADNYLDITSANNPIYSNLNSPFLKWLYMNENMAEDFGDGHKALDGSSLECDGDLSMVDFTIEREDLVPQLPVLIPGLWGQPFYVESRAQFYLAVSVGGQLAARTPIMSNRITTPFKINFNGENIKGTLSLKITESGSTGVLGYFVNNSIFCAYPLNYNFSKGN